ncbi:Toxin SpoIISA, type II toxin-antitoxin system [Evansella caseinilytica]|uniref:Toxin SpoIISA, type II toxin-antitoxin system n=1 Tax=Evansella caseinilytica TaxID=1503961 RepID=A0A1H3V2F0_9BACI|nr:Toxin SpoIISA, type II toxin-antitoxin system [Evansella caseinilytica]
MLILLIVFVIIDSLFFLNLYISKLGGQELQSTITQVGVTQKELDATRRKMAHVPQILICFNFPLYNVSKDAYIDNMERLLKEYAQKESLVIDLIPFGTKKEREAFLDTMGTNKDKVRRFLRHKNSFTSSKDNLALYPFEILDYPYVVQVQTTDDKLKITEDDGNAITTLIIAYCLAIYDVKKEAESGDEE